MAVSKYERRESKVEFDNTYYKIYSDLGRIVDNKFGIKRPLSDTEAIRLNSISERMIKVVSDIGTYIRMANSIYPRCAEEINARRTMQGKAIGLCFDLLTKYQNIFHEFKVGEEKYVIEMKNISHEINCLKKWRESDNKRFNFG